MHKRKRPSPGLGGASLTVPSLPSTLSVHDFHKFGVHPNSVAPGFHFHLAASINPDTDIPLLPAMAPDSEHRHGFSVHWLNNKELQFTSQAEQLMATISQHVKSQGHSPDRHSPTVSDVEEDSDREEATGSDMEPNASATNSPKHSKKDKSAKKRRGLLHRHRSLQISTESERSIASSHSMGSFASNATETTVIAEQPQAHSGATTTSDTLDREIEVLLRDWHQSSDMLFSIHPTDGSYLVWLVDWLDEASPGAFRQAQISFSSRIPHALPLADATTMSARLAMYCNYGRPDLKTVMKESESKLFDDSEKPDNPQYSANVMGKSSPGQSDNTLTPNALMLSRHEDGSLNVWQVSFAESSKFSTVLSVAHVSRACGHRFQTNSATCHPVLPLLLTTSHHNLPEDTNELDEPPPPKSSKTVGAHKPGPDSFCSELILWRVDPIGPLSKSGGIAELARINSPDISAFANVAWLPTLLPSSTLGSSGNSPSALFIASDGDSLRVYQAVIDARTLLADNQTTKQRERLAMSGSNSSASSGWVMQSASTPRGEPQDGINIVSLQSTARPGCIIERDPIADAKQDWQHIQLIHIFQEQLITGQHRTGKQANVEPMVDLQDTAVFEEYFYLVVVEKLVQGGSVLHMWQIVIASQGSVEVPEMYSPDVNYFQEMGDSPCSSRSQTPEPVRDRTPKPPPKLHISTNKVCTQPLELPENVHVVHATVAAGHLSSSSIYPACFSPYLLSTACSDSQVHFWRCKVTGDASTQKYEWVEWEMMIRTEDTSAIKISGKPISVSCSYSGRVAVAHRTGHVHTQNDNPNNKFVNLCVSIYECESTGGSEWTLEDTIELKNISLTDPKLEVDLTHIYSNDIHTLPNVESQVLMTSTPSTPAIVRTPIPSAATVQSVRRTISQNHLVNSMLRQKHLVQLDWVSAEDGSHLLTVAVGPRVLLYAAVSSEIVHATQRDNRAKMRPRQGILQKSKTMTVGSAVEEIRWMKLRSLELSTADCLPPLPMHLSWVREGLLVVGMDNEMHVYSQWRGPGEGLDVGSVSSGSQDTEDAGDSRTLTEHKLHSVSSTASLNVMAAGKGFKLSPSVSSLKITPSISNLSLLMDRKERERRRDDHHGKGELTKVDSLSSIQLIQDSGLFEASRLASPVLPQYHPKQLIELLNFGRIRRVKAILAHLLRCISGSEANTMGVEEVHQGHQRVRPLSVATPQSPHEGPQTIPEEMQLDYIEISSIPPLPLYALLAADHDTSTFTQGETATNTHDGAAPDYSSLFDPDNVDSDLMDPFDAEDELSTSPKVRCAADRRNATPFSNLNHFGLNQSRQLARHLTHTHLPGLSSLDQMYLLALGDTVANTKVDFTEKETADPAAQSAATREPGQPAPLSTEAVDDCGLRFLLAARHHVYLMNTLPIRQRAQLQNCGLSPAYYVWAFHSEAEEELLQAIPSVQKGEPRWTDLRQFGVGWWLRNINNLRRCIEKLAKSAFQARKDPLDAALFYMAMKKKNVLWGLFRSVNDDKMAKFFRNNFDQDRWRKAALKNAFALLGRQRFIHAAAFFLLAGSLKDAVEVCVRNLEDVQLGLVVCRLYAGGLDESLAPSSVPSGDLPPSVCQLLQQKGLGLGLDIDPARQHPDPFLRSMSYWMLKDYSASLGTLLDTAANHPTTPSGEMEDYAINPSVFNFYNYLRTHPLLVRQHLASTAADSCQTVLLSGFSHGSQVVASEKNVTYVDRITPIERRLYFTTAHAHFKNGCPALALEVLSKLPAVVDMNSDITKSRSADSVCSKAGLNTGTLDAVTEPVKSQDWSAPCISDKLPDTDWSRPLANGGLQLSGGLDWGSPVSKFEEEKLDLGFSDDDADDSDTKSDSEIESREKLGSTDSVEAEKEATQPKDDPPVGDIMAQQLKFMACLRLMMEELATLATGFEVDGGQLRYQLFLWLEREVDVLKILCNYGQTAEDMAEQSENEEHSSMTSQKNSSSTEVPDKPTLHEILLAEKMDFDAKLQRLQKRKQWLRENQHLLRTLLSYAVLHGSGGGGLASVRMELLLLLQELQQERPQQQLLSPLPFPTSLPLLSASIASAKTVVSDPIQQLQSVVQDLLHTVIEFKVPPTFTGQLNKVIPLRNLSAALSACIYQCLCDSDNFVVQMSDAVSIGMEGFASTMVVYKDSYLMAGAQRRRKCSSAGDEPPNSQPSKWPGVSSLRALLAREKDEDCPRLNVLLCESLVAVYMSLLIHALSMYDANILYRLAGHTFTHTMWPTLFGGGVRKLVKLPPSPDVHRNVACGSDETAKHRMKFHMRVLRQPPSQQQLKDDRPTYKEKFSPPVTSMLSYFMAKPYVNPQDEGVDYDSTESISSDEEEEEEEMIGARRNDAAMEEHLDPNSYSWCLMRYALFRLINNSLLTFLPQIGLELQELPVISPLLQAVLKVMSQWEDLLQKRLEMFSGPPPDYIPGCFVDTMTEGPPATKYKALQEPMNTPFLSNHYAALPAKRLWHYLTNQEYLQDVFIRYVFKRGPSVTKGDGLRTGSPDTEEAPVDDPMKVIHKDQDGITAFCINQGNLNCISVSTQKDLVEMDIGGILNPPAWLDDVTEYDIETINNPGPSQLTPEEFLVVQTPSDRQLLNASTPSAPGVIPTPSIPMAQSGRGGSVMLKRQVSGVRRMGAHPHLPYYLTGAQDGSVRLWEWGHQQCITVARQPGSFPKVSKVLFNAQGNKFAVADAEGSVCLWQVGLGLNMNKPYMNLKCHTKAASDVVFVGSSSLLATSGHSSENKNVCLWDTLMPQRSAMVQAFHCHPDGSPSLLYAPQHQLLLSGGRRGEVCLFDLRQRQLRHTFQAHDSAVRCMALHPMEEYFITGAADGDIKVWGLAVHNLQQSFPGEHARASLFRNLGSGVTQLALSSSDHLFSCGADGSMKVRQLPQRDHIVNTW